MCMRTTYYIQAYIPQRQLKAIGQTAIDIENYLKLTKKLRILGCIYNKLCIDII